MKRGTASRVILGKNTIAEMPGGVFVGTDVILGKKDGLTNDFNGLVLSNTVMLGKKVSHAAIISVIVRGADRIVLPDAIANSLSYVKAFGGTEQNGTPTPDAPMDIVSNNGVIKYGQYSNNIFNKNDTASIGNWYTSSALKIAGAAANQTLVMRAKPGATYYYKHCSVTGGGRAFYTEVEDWDIGSDCSAMVGSATIHKDEVRSITVSENAKWVFFNYGRSNQTVTPEEQLADFMVSLTPLTSDTPYEPYRAGIYTDGTVETINVHGKNLFDINSATIRGVRYTVTAVGNNIEAVAGDNTNASSRISIYIPVSFFKENTTYYFNSKSDTSFDTSRCTVGKATPDSTADLSYYGAISQTENNGYSGSFTITDIAPDQEYVSFFYYLGAQDANTKITISDIQIEQGSTATEYEPYFDGGTATAEMLLKVGNYQDVQSILDGVVTRNIGVKVLDGTENWVKGTTQVANYSFWADDTSLAILTDRTILCTHFQSSQTLPPATQDDRNNKIWRGTSDIAGTRASICIGYNFGDTVAQFKQFLADQYAAGTPVIVVYPLATPTTESVAGQTLQVTGGDNVLEITQASLTGLELEAQYNTQVQLTVQEVESANLDNDVTVTIL